MSNAPTGAIVYGIVIAKIPMIAIHSRCRRVPRLDSPNEPAPPKPCGPAYAGVPAVFTYLPRSALRPPNSGTDSTATGFEYCFWSIRPL
jgi:hypothetical protein